jgi:hypothetical protein
MVAGASGRAAVAVVLVLSLAAACAPVGQATRPSTSQMAGIRRLAVVVAPDSEFTVLKERRGGAGGAAVAGAVGGLVGVLLAGAVHSGITADKDRAHAAAVAPHVGGLAPPTILAASMLGALRASGAFTAVELLEQSPPAPDRSRFDGVLVVRLPAWGLVVVSDNPDRVSAFVELAVQMTPAEGGPTIWEESHTALGRERLPLETFKGDASLTRQELTATLETAGQRLAYELLYPRGAPR